jgi:hypothetical protein
VFEIDSEFTYALVIDSEEAAILVFRGNEGHLTNMIQHASLEQKYFPFLPFAK